MKKLLLMVISSSIILGITFILYSCQQSEIEIKINQNSEQEIKPAIENYIQSEIFIKDFFGSGSINGKTFCSYHYLGAKQKNTTKTKNTINTYIWLLCDEYNRKLNRGSAASVPIALMLENDEKNYQVINHQYPRDGGFYSEDIKKLFPTTVRRKIDDLDQNKIVNDLNRENIRKAETYFQKVK